MPTDPICVRATTYQNMTTLADLAIKSLFVSNGMYIVQTSMNPHDLARLCYIWYILHHIICPLRGYIICVHRDKTPKHCANFGRSCN